MTYKVLKSLVYGGIAYAVGQKVDIIEKSVAENCLERELIAEITDTEIGNIEMTGEIDSTEITEDNEENEDATEEVVSSETSEETTENEDKKKKSRQKLTKEIENR